MSTQAPPDHPRRNVLRKPAVLERTGLSDTTIWRLERKGEFPKSIRLSKRARGWHESDVEQWIAERPEK